MIGRVLKVIIIICCVLVLCSFAPKTQMYENKDLHIWDNYIKETLITVAEEENKTVRSNDIRDSVEEKLDDIFSEFVKIVPEGIPTDPDELAGAVGIDEVINYVSALLRDGMGNMSTFYLFVGVALLFCLSELLSEDMGEAAAAVRAGTALVLSAPVIEAAADIVESVGVGIADGSEFFAGVIPILTSVCAISAGGVTAGCATATMGFSLSFVSGILAKNLFPAAMLIFIASMLSAVDTGQGIAAVAKGIRGWFNFIIGITSLLIVAILGAQTFITAASDSLAIRGAKYAISGMIPVVGGTVSGVLGMLISGVKLLSGSIGAISVAALLSFMGAPLIQLLFYRLCIGACVIITSFSGASFGERFFSSVKGAVDCLIAVLTSSLMIFILEIIILTVNLNNIV